MKSWCAMRMLATWRSAWTETRLLIRSTFTNRRCKFAPKEQILLGDGEWVWRLHVPSQILPQQPHPPLQQLVEQVELVVSSLSLNQGTKLAEVRIIPTIQLHSTRWLPSAAALQSAGRSVWPWRGTRAKALSTAVLLDVSYGRVQKVLVLPMVCPVLVARWICKRPCSPRPIGSKVVTTGLVEELIEMTIIRATTRWSRASSNWETASNSACILTAARVSSFPWTAVRFGPETFALYSISIRAWGISCAWPTEFEAQALLVERACMGERTTVPSCGFYRFFHSKWNLWLNRTAEGQGANNQGLILHIYI